MCKEMTTICKCDRCGSEKMVEPRKVGKIYVKGKYPEDWTNINDFWLCDGCSEKYAKTFQKFMEGN